MQKIAIKMLFVATLFFGLMFGVESKAATQAEIDNCIRTGGSGLNMVGYCKDCPSGKVSNNGVCVDPNDTGPSSLPDATIKDFYGNEKTPAAPVVISGPVQFKYTLLESLPGFYTAKQSMTDFPALILSIYKFLIWTVGIAGLFMIVIGGIMYMTSAGNTSSLNSAKSVIWDAIYGIIGALTAYLFLYVINPDLVKISLDFSSVTVSEMEDAQVSGSTSTTMVARNGQMIDVSFDAALNKIKNEYGVNTVVASGLRTVEKQKQLIVQNCGGYPATRACSPPTCLLKNGSDSCPHTTGRAADIWALNTSGQQAISQANCKQNISACFQNPYQQKLVAAMKANGFCVLRSEPWHFEKPKMSSACDF